MRTIHTARNYLLYDYQRGSERNLCEGVLNNLHRCSRVRGKGGTFCGAHQRQFDRLEPREQERLVPPTLISESA